jgi:hypothetical protein
LTAYAPFLAISTLLLEQAVCASHSHGTDGTSREICKGLFNLLSTKDQGTTASPSNPLEAKRHSVTKRGHHATVVSRDDGNVPDIESLRILLSGTSI